ncbi:MAG: type I restriction endonuclease subunit R [Anaerolineaceae bacterium]|nr:type I restriction endonuclease subunit R [Anaerolineaceae bacterium]
MTSDTSEKGLEMLICRALSGSDCLPSAEHLMNDDHTAYITGGWLPGRAADYDREYTVDLFQLSAFLQATQPKTAQSLDLGKDSPTRRKFFSRLQGEISAKGVIEVLRNGLLHGAHQIELFYGTPSAGNTLAQERFTQNRFSITRQLRYSRDETQLSLDLGLFINGLPIATFELKNSLTKQTVMDAIRQYQRDRDPREKLFEFGRCMVHFAVDDAEVRMCTHLKGKASWFLPFNKGWNDGAGNPPNPNGLKTAYLWEEVLTRASLTNIIENYAQVVQSKDEKTKRKTTVQIFPRYHQLDVVRKLLADATKSGCGKRYLIQHSAGSGKSNSIAWLAHQLVGIREDEKPIFDSVIVVTDRRVLDKQIRDTIKQFVQVSSTVGAVTQGSGQLREFLEAGKKIIISTVQKFPYILDEIGNEQRNHKFAIIIDEAHSSQGGRTQAAMSMALSTAGVEEDDETTEDTINRIMESRKMLPNASYFAFTATPKNKTLEIFGEAYKEGDVVKHRPFHTYTMKQAIQEGFILDVLANYTPINSYYKLVKKIEGDPEYDVKRARKKLRRYVEGHDYAVRLKAEIMVDHFHENVIALNKIGGKARAMVVTGSVDRAIQYYHAFSAYLLERKSPYQAVVAFSGERDDKGVQVTEASLNGFPSNDIPEKIKEDPYRFLICAEKFQTGYDEPLLHTMYVDKLLTGIKAVQTLSRLNRAHPQKSDVFVLDFQNDADTIQAAFQDYYRTTILADETDPDKLHDLKASLDAYQLYTPYQVETLVEKYLHGAQRNELDPILDAVVESYTTELDEDGQVDFKSKAKTFSRTYAFLSLILPYSNATWEKFSIFLNFLIPKLPAPIEEDLSKGILESIDMDSYRAEKKAVEKILLEDSDAEIDPVPTSADGFKIDPELEALSAIIKSFNDQFGNIPWSDRDRINRMIIEEIPVKLAADVAYQNAQTNSDKQNARIEHDRALARVITGLLQDDTELFKQFFDNESFRTWLAEKMFGLTYRPENGLDARVG